MLRIVARLRRRARAMPRRSPLTRVTPALFIATSVPVPMAMPTSAFAKAGASLMPSPAMDDDAAFFLQPLEQHELVRRLDLTRSEEHTSELQSQSNLVCRLLLEKKNTISNRNALASLFRPTTTVESPPSSESAC